MMHCWKSIPISRQDGFFRLVITSFLTMLLTFIVLYSIAHAFHDGVGLNDQYFAFFIFALILLYPVHKALHYLPLRILGGKCRLFINKKGQLKFRLHEPVAKNIYKLALIFPFVILTLVGIVFTLSFPQYFHYGVLLIALHTGLCVEDFIFYKNLSHTPKACLVDETEDSLEILINGLK
ncbi:hypothetical protein ABID53_000683 [Bacillus oleivorans]